jgi:hypothetical protein
MNRYFGFPFDRRRASAQYKLLSLFQLASWHLAPFVLLILGVTVALQGWQVPYFGAARDDPTDRLVWVDPTGPAAQAGLRVGDVLLTVDGVPIDRSPLWRNKRAGESVEVHFLRAGQPHTTYVVVIAPLAGEQALRLSLLLIAFSFWLIGTVVAFLRPRQPEARRLVLLCLSVATVLVVQLLVYVQVNWAIRLSGTAAAWVSATLIDLHSLFPVRLDRRKPLVYGAYTLSGSLTGWYLLWDPQDRATSLWAMRPSTALLLYFLVAVLITTVLLIHAYWCATHADRAPESAATVRRRVRLVLAGTALALIPPSLLLFTPMLLYLPPLVPDAVPLLSLVLLPLTYAYGIYRYNLMGIDFLINRVVVYLTLGLLLLVVYFAVAFVILSLALGSGAPLTETGPAVLLAGALASLIAVAVMTPLRRRVDLTWERLFYPDVYGYRGAVDILSRRLTDALDDARLAGLLVRDLSDAMDLEGAALFLAQDGHLVRQAATGTLERVDFGRLSTTGPLAQHLAQAGTPVDGESLSRLQIVDCGLWIDNSATPRIPRGQSPIRNPLVGAAGAGGGTAGGAAVGGQAHRRVLQPAGSPAPGDAGRPGGAGGEERAPGGRTAGAHGRTGRGSPGTTGSLSASDPLPGGGAPPAGGRVARRGDPGFDGPEA